MHALPHDRDMPRLRLSLRDLIMLLRACSGGSYVVGHVEVEPTGEPAFGVQVRVLGHVRPGKAGNTQAHHRRPAQPASRSNPLAQLLAAAEALDAAARASLGQSADALWDMSLRQLLTRALLARYACEAANR